MRLQKVIIFCVFFIANNFYCVSQASKKIHFSLLSQDDDISFLEKKVDKSTYEKLKFINFGERTYLSFGGGYRFQAENFVNENFTNQDDQDNIWYLNRIMLHSHFKIENKLEVFAELNSSSVINKEDISPVDMDILSVNQMFVRYNFNRELSLLIGRENLKFGSGRLVDIREGPNVRRSFDISRLDYIGENIKITGFFAIPIKLREKAFDNEFLKLNETFSGIYFTKYYSKAFNYDIYGLYQKDDAVTYNSGTANERRYTVGSRFFGTYKNLTFNNEFVYQIGNYGNLDIQAYTLSLQGELQCHFIGDEIKLGFKTELISGDNDITDDKLNTFDGLYPRGAYFGRVARFGPSNLIDIHPYINIEKSSYYLEMDYDAFWRYSNTDSVYNAALLVEYPSLNDRSFIANQFGGLLGYNVNDNLNIELETNVIIPGDFLKKNNLTATLFHAVITTEFKF